MTLQQLRFLIAVAESGSINAAAQRLYTAQSNISNAVKSLEQELHLEIFTRSSRGVTLTNDGTELLGYARHILSVAAYDVGLPVLPAWRHSLGRFCVH